MTDFITRFAELAGAETAAILQAEFGGCICYVPLPPAGPVAVVLHAQFSPLVPVAQVAQNLSRSLQELASSGVEVTAVGIQARSIGSGYIAALEKPMRQLGIEVRAVL